MTPSEHIPLDACIKGHIYKIRSRNLGVGVYDGSGGFIGIREKFGQLYLFTEYHHDQGAPFGTVRPIADLGPLPTHIKPIEILTHQHGNNWAERNGEIVPVLRRDLEPDEHQHGGRQGFVDLWVDTGARLPDNQYPCFRQNDALFDYLKTPSAPTDNNASNTNIRDPLF